MRVENISFVPNPLEPFSWPGKNLTTCITTPTSNNSDIINPNQSPIFTCDYYMLCDRSSISNNYTLILAFTILFVLSALGLIFIASTIIYNRKLQSHPQMLIAQICIAEGCMSWNAFVQVVGPVYINCYFGLSKIFAFSLFQGEYWRPHKNEDNLTSMQCASNYLCNTNPLFFQFFQLLSLMLNTCLCIDLVLTIKSPFSPAARRQ